MKYAWNLTNKSRTRKELFANKREFKKKADWSCIREVIMSENALRTARVYWVIELSSGLACHSLYGRALEGGVWRSEDSEFYSSDYDHVNTWEKSLSELKVVQKHCLRNKLYAYVNLYRLLILIIIITIYIYIASFPSGPKTLHRREIIIENYKLLKYVYKK